MKARHGSKAVERLFMVGFMFAVTFVCISAVSAIHLVSAETVAANAKLYLYTGIAAAAGAELPDDPERVRAWYESHVTPVRGREGEVRYYRTPDGVVFIRRGVGLWGTIEAVVGMDRDLDRFTGMAFTAHNETPGLGARIEEAWFKRQVVGKRGGLSLVPEGTRSSDPQELDAITGATITSTAVRDLLNRLAEEAPESIASGQEHRE